MDARKVRIHWVKKAPYPETQTEMLNLRRLLGLIGLKSLISRFRSYVHNRFQTRRSIAQIPDRLSSIEAHLASIQLSDENRAAWAKEHATQLARLYTTTSAHVERVEKVAKDSAAWVKESAVQLGRLNSQASAHFQRVDAITKGNADWVKESAKQLGGLHATLLRKNADVEFDRVVTEIASGDAPVLLGPWLSEVGYEILYWVPFLQWLVREYEISSDRLVAISRGGVSSWYANLTSNYVEILDGFSVSDIRNASAARAACQDQSIKQYECYDFDRAVIKRAQEFLRLDGFLMLHPCLMYKLFQPYWAGRQSHKQVLSRLNFKRFCSVEHPLRSHLPTRYTAAKFYTRASSSSGDAWQLIKEHICRIAERTQVVLMDPHIGIDEHDPLAFGDRNITSIKEFTNVEDNLGFQSSVVSDAEIVLSTFGGFTYLPVLFGTPSIGILSDAGHLLGTHGNIMFGMAEALDGSITIVDSKALGRAGFG